MNSHVSLDVNVKIKKEGRGRTRVEEYHNKTVDVGLNWIRDLLFGESAGGLTHFAVGTGTATEQSTDIALGAEKFRDTYTKITKIDKGLEITYYLSSLNGNGHVLSEAGLFGGGATSTAGSGRLYARVTFPGDSKSSSEAWTFTWTVTWEGGQ